MKPSTRRMYRRVPAECLGYILSADALHWCRIQDLSLNGFRIQSEMTLVPGAFVMVRIWLPGVSEPIDIDQAVVRWADGGECGVQIVALSNRADFQLAGFVELLLLQQSVSRDASQESGILWINGDGAGTPARAHAARRQGGA